MIKKLILLSALLCGSSLALPPGGTTVQVTARLADPGNVIVVSRTFVRAELKNTGGQQCRVGGTEVITPYLKDFAPDSSGNVTAILQKNSAITCGSSTGNTQWAFTIWRDGKPQPTCFLQVNAGIALESAACLNSSPTPITTLPTDSVYARVDGSNAGFTGTITDTVSVGAPLFVCTEGTAPSGLVGFDLLYCDSSLHRPRWINNNGTVTSDALLSDNLGSFASTTSAQLASVISDESGSGPMLFANANTQDSPTITTKATITETTAPSGSAGKDVIYADSTAHRLKMNNNNGGADTVVGAATVDTFTSKALQGAGSGNSVNLLNSQGPLGAVVGTGADATLYTYTIPANTIQAGKGIRLRISVNHSTGSAAVSYKLKLGATTLYTAGGAATSAATLNFEQEIFNAAGVQNSQFAQLVMIDSATITANITFTSAENSANSLALTFTMNVAATDQVTPKFWRVELIQ